MRTIPRGVSLSLLLVLGSIPAWGQSLSTALDATNLTWSTSGTFGATGWAGETSNTHDGVSAARSGTVFGNSQTSIIQTTVTGPGTFTFWWANPSLYNLFSCSSSNVTFFAPSQSPWQQQVCYVGTGTQTVRWIYATGPGSDSTSRGYLDQVSYVPGAVAPSIPFQPLSQSQVAGFPVTFKVGALGTPPLSFQWQFNTVAIPGATNSAFTVTNVDSSSLGAYSVLVTNMAGSILSSNATLELGQLTAWGSSAANATSVPPGATNLLAIDAGDYDGLMLRSDGTVAAWGKVSLGQTNVPGDLSNVIAISAGGFHCLALKSDGTVASWGDNRYGQTNVPSGLSNVVAIAGGAYHSLVLLADGTVAAWGGNPFNSYTETNVPPGLSNVVAIAANSYSLALRDDGTCTNWGGGPAIPPDLSNVVAIAAGDAHSVALLADGTVRAWGQNTLFQTNLPAGLSNVVSIAAGAYHTLALTSDGRVVGWGTRFDSDPLVLPQLTNAVVVIAAGSQHDFALVENPPQLLLAAISDISAATNSLYFSIPSRSGRVYALQSADSLESPNWRTVRLIAGTGVPLNVVESINQAKRFYRVLRW